MLNLFRRTRRPRAGVCLPGPARPSVRCVVEPLEGRQLLTVPSGFAETQVTASLQNPINFAVAPDGRVFVCQKNGRIRIVKNGTLLPQPFLDIPVQTFGERGVIGIAFDPDFATNHFVYVQYTANAPTVHNRVSRFTASGDVASPASEQVLLNLPDLRSVQHNGGTLEFGNDGKLYVFVGDNHIEANGQDLNTTFGKVLRINPDGTIPSDNPFFNTATGNNRAIWAYGLRNPFGGDIDPVTGRVFVNDVGPGEVEPPSGTFEEINEATKGANFGWPLIQGHRTTQPAPSGYKDPLYAYSHTADGKSGAITGGAFYNPATQQFPESYKGLYFFADFTSGIIKTYNPADDAVTPFATGGQFPVDIDVAPDGTLYWLRYGTDVNGTGGAALFKITFTGSNAPNITSPPADRTAVVGETVTFTVTASGAAPLTYQWLRDGVEIPGATSANLTLNNVQASDSGAQFRAVVTNGSGSATSAAATLTVSSDQPPVPVINLPADGSIFRGGQAVDFSGSATDPEDGVLPASAFEWAVLFHHDDHSHPFLDSVAGVTGGTFTPFTIGETSDNVWFRIHLTVTDSDGVSRSVFRDVLPHKADFTLTSNIPGVPLTVDGQSVSNPVTLTGVTGVTRVLGAPPVATVGGVTYDFVSWSDGGAASHEISTPEAATTYTATYSPRGGSTGSPDLVAAVAGTFPLAAVGGNTGKAAVRLTNQGDGLAKGPVTVRWVVSADDVFDDGDSLLREVTRNVNLKNGKGKTFNTSFEWPANLPAGGYRVLARVDGSAAIDGDADNNTAVSDPLTLSPPAVNLSGAFTGTVPLSLSPLQKVSLSLRLSNAGPDAARSTIHIPLTASTDVQDILLHTATLKLKLKAGAAKTVKFNLRIPETLTPGVYTLLAAIDLPNLLTETNEGDNLVTTVR